MDLLDLSAQLGARAFVDRAGHVHLRNRFAGEVFCGATEPDSGDPPAALADGATPEEAGIEGPVETWPWCEECRILGRGAGILVYVPDAAVQP
jgi:hypothetical protein